MHADACLDATSDARMIGWINQAGRSNGSGQLVIPVATSIKVLVAY